MFDAKFEDLQKRHQLQLPPEMVTDIAKLLSEAIRSSGGSPVPPSDPVTAGPFRTVVDLDGSSTIDLGSHCKNQAAVGLDPEKSERPLGGEGRYEALGLLGVGAMGEVRRVRDRMLGRIIAMKVIHPNLLEHPQLVARFFEEAQCAAQLQHPGLVAVYDSGRTANGALYFTMAEIRGRTLTKAIAEVHAASAFDNWGTTENGWGLRRLLTAFVQICDALGYAHSRGCIHRDLKPDNIMLGENGEVQVVDWGLAKVLGRPDREDVTATMVSTARSLDHRQATRAGRVAGTPVYMSPEQAAGENDKIDARTDIYALGAVLYEILSGRCPYSGTSAADVVNKVITSPPEPLCEFKIMSDEDPPEPVEGGSPPIPEELVKICQTAMARAIEDRFASAELLSAEVTAWIDGAHRREKALGEVARAHELSSQIQHLRGEAETLMARATEALRAIEVWRPEENKVALWADQDRAMALEREADALDGRLDLNLQGALRIDPGLEEAHVALAGRHFSALVDAETDRNQDAIVRQEALLTIHTEALHPGHAVRKRCATFLKGTGALTLHTREEGAEVILNRYELKNRRLVAVPVRSLGRTPIDRIDLPKGSYLCTLQHPGSASAPQVRYPVHIGRSQHWDGIRPGGSAPFPLWLPRAPAASVSPDLLEAECYIPPGWFLAGGDPEANEPSSRRRLWVDGFILHRFAVTNRNYIAFLNDLVLQGREEDAVRFSPQMNAAVLGEVGVLLYARTASGGFDVTVDADGDSWDLDWPVLSINWGQSYAYCQWLALKMRRPFRLPGEFEWEKAARGVDGRKFPWGDTHDPSFCWMRESSSEQPLPQMVGLSKADESPFGLMEMAGNMRTWCLDTLEGSGPNTAGDLVLPPEAGDVSPRPLGDFRGRAYRRTRGGAWPLSEQESRCASRHREEALVRNPFNGVRVARPAPED